MALYTDIVMDHFMHPRNVGEIPNADGVGEVGNAKCGDIMKMYLSPSSLPSRTTTTAITSPTTRANSPTATTAKPAAWCETGKATRKGGFLLGEIGGSDAGATLNGRRGGRLCPPLAPLCKGGCQRPALTGGLSFT